MPNWCSNVATLRHADREMLVRAHAAFQRGELLNEFIPCPQALRDTESVYYPDGHAQFAAQDARERENLRLYGARTWYDWRVAHWGTKWDIVGDDGSCFLEDQFLTLNFDSAWSPPCAAYETLMSLGFSIDAFYYEPGMAFCGSWFDGADTCFDIPSTSAEADLVIPDDIDQAFDIVNSMATWEDEEADPG